MLAVSLLRCQRGGLEWTRGHLCGTLPFLKKVQCTGCSTLAADISPFIDFYWNLNVYWNVCCVFLWSSVYLISVSLGTAEEQHSVSWMGSVNLRPSSPASSSRPSSASLRSSPSSWPSRPSSAEVCWHLSCPKPGRKSFPEFKKKKKLKWNEMKDEISGLC